MTTSVPYTAVIAKLLAASGVTDLVAQDVFPRLAPESVRQRAVGSTTFSPYIVIRRPPGDTRDHLMSRRDTFRKTPMIIYCCADTHLSASNIADAVETAVDSDSTTQSGTQGWGSYGVDHCEIKDAYDASFDPSIGDEIGFPVEAILIDVFHFC